MILNISANMLGLGNAATPFGIKAIQELDKLNSRPGTATNAMTLFLAINTAGLALLPTGMIGVRAALGSNDPAGIVATTWFRQRDGDGSGDHRRDSPGAAAPAIAGANRPWPPRTA